VDRESPLEKVNYSRQRMIDQNQSFSITERIAFAKKQVNDQSEFFAKKTHNS